MIYLIKVLYTSVHNCKLSCQSRHDGWHGYGWRLRVVVPIARKKGPQEVLIHGCEQMHVHQFFEKFSFAKLRQIKNYVSNIFHNTSPKIKKFKRLADILRMQRTVKWGPLCRSWQELSNDYLVAKIGFDTAENEPCKLCPLCVYSYHIAREF